MTTILKVEGLVKAYTGGTLALKGIDLTVEEGEFIAVIGPSGAGKSTLLRSINRLIEPTEGTVAFLGEVMNSNSKRSLRRWRAQIGMIFQHYNLVNRSSVLENVLHGRLGYMSPLAGVLGRYSEEDKQAAVDLLTKVGLGNEVFKRADELSGGQMQRVGISRAIMQQPKLILADEPIASLDPKSSSVVMDTIYENCRSRGIACLVNLHQVEVAKKYATRIVGIKGGAKVFDGSPEELTEEMIYDIYQGKEHEMHAQASGE
ncbi:phosphonate ABC transporter ATP-binding protein [Paenibacillus typhae]|uniref:Phosphonate transport system ATP-binding protein n=1 Tax=Paenibacillus typhae TaxID=1174501 RepID=A0A1G9AY29_9BACL|nr:phosphonate ABC transporter ATP-binding protein [Paenibacillus typhae]SDK32162.1 phosphonate transport system ATP-binding protein [Paenibacillus typhae]